MSTLNDFYPVPSAGVDYDTWAIGTPPDYSDTTGFTVVNNVSELTAAIDGGNYQIYFNNGTYDVSNLNRNLPVGQVIKFRGQSKAGVILTLDTLTTSDSFLFNGTGAANEIVELTNVTSYGSVRLEGLFQAAGIAIGDYVEIRLNDHGDTQRYVLYQIVDVQAGYVDVNLPLASNFEIGDNITVVKQANVNDSNVTLENITFRGETTGGGGWHIFDGLNNAYVINASVNDCNLIHRGVSLIIERDRNTEWVFDRCEFSTTETITLASGFELPYGSRFVDTKFTVIHVNNSGEGFEFTNCYFDSVLYWRDGGYYERCFFEKHTPASLFYDNSGQMNFYDHVTVIEPRYVNVKSSEKIVVGRGLPSFTHTSILASNSTVQQYSGAHRVASAYFLDTTTNLVTGVENPGTFLTSNYKSGTTYITFTNSTIPNTTMYFTLVSVG